MKSHLLRVTLLILRDYPIKIPPSSSRSMILQSGPALLFSRTLGFSSCRGSAGKGPGTTAFGFLNLFHKDRIKWNVNSFSLMVYNNNAEISIRMMVKTILRSKSDLGNRRIIAATPRAAATKIIPIVTDFKLKSRKFSSISFRKEILRTILLAMKTQK